MNITLSSAKRTPVTAEFNGDSFTFEILNFTVAQQEEYEAIVKKVIDEDGTMADLHKAQWDFAIKECSLKDPLQVLPYSDVRKIIKLVNEVNNGVDEKKS